MNNLVAAFSIGWMLLAGALVAQTVPQRGTSESPNRTTPAKTNSIRGSSTKPPALSGSVQRQKLSEQQLRILVEDLSAPKFIEREAATLNLIAAGQQGVEAIAKMLDKNRPEAMLRAIHVLKTIGLRGDLASQKSAQLALRELTNRKDETLSRRAMLALAAVNTQRQDEAVRLLRSLGASVEVRTSRFNMQFVRMFTVRIDDSWRGTDKDLVRLQWLANCEQVEFRGKSVKDDWFKHLRFMPRLRALSVRDAQLSDDAFKKCAKAKTIQFLDVRYTPVTDTTANAIRDMPKLTSVTLYGTKITMAAAAEIKKRHPGADVDYRRGAFLGIGCPSPPNPCIVTQLKPGTAAAKADIREQDVIVKFDERKINDFDDLRTMIGSKFVGDSATIVVIRPAGRRVASTLRVMNQQFGIVAEKHALGLRIKSVAKDSAAANMMLQPNDVISVFMGSAVDEPKDLAARYARAQVGRPMRVTFSRDHKELTKKVVFGRWANED